MGTVHHSHSLAVELVPVVWHFPRVRFRVTDRGSACRQPDAAFGFGSGLIHGKLYKYSFARGATKWRDSRTRRLLADAVVAGTFRVQAC